MRARCAGRREQGDKGDCEFLHVGSLLGAFVRCGEDVRLAGIELTLHSANDPIAVPDESEHKRDGFFVAAPSLRVDHDWLLAILGHLPSPSAGHPARYLACDLVPSPLTSPLFGHNLAAFACGVQSAFPSYEYDVLL